jgi:anti-sigma B factor antagonist
MVLDIKIREREPGVYLVGITGEVNTETAPELEKKVRGILPQSKALVFELKDMTYISSMGLSVFFRLKQAIEEKQGTLLFVEPQAQIQKVFDAMKVFPDAMMASLQEADEYLDSFLDAVQKGKVDPKKPAASS